MSRKIAKIQDLIGRRKKLKHYVLPTKRDILRYYLYLFPNDKNFISTIAKEITEIWLYAGIPTTKRGTVRKYCIKIHKEYRDLTKHSSEYQKTLNFKTKAQMFKKNSERLFDIALCKCNAQCSCGTNITKELRHFLRDQPTDRTLKISDVNVQ